MAYIGVSPSNGVRKKHTYTATASQTSFSGAGAEGITLAYRDSNYVDVYQNGVKLADEDYTATSGTAIVLAQGASADDIVEIIAFDVFSVADTVSKADGGTFDGNVAMAGTLGVTGVLTGTSLDISGDIDVDGTTNLDVVDIDGAVNMATTALVTGVLTANGGAVFNEGSADVDFRVESNGNANMLFVDGGNDRVGVGGTPTAYPLEIYGANGDGLVVRETTNSVTNWFGGFNSAGTVGTLTNHPLTLVTNATERMRIDSSGNVLVGKTASNSTVAGSQLNANGLIIGTTSETNPLLLNRLSTNGDIIDFRKDSTTIGTIGADGGKLYVNSLGSNLVFQVGGTSYINMDSTHIYPQTDNAYDLGSAGNRFDDVFATNDAIQTSDRNEKQDIAELSDAEKRVAIVVKGLMRKYRWKDAVAEKGDDARTHFGIIAQDLQDAFTAESLDAGDYAMFCSDTWWEKEISVDAVEADEEKGIEAKDAYTYMDTKDEATDGYTEKTRLGVRYSELLAFIISAI
jgi:hypothetical protein